MTRSPLPRRRYRSPRTLALVAAAAATAVPLVARGQSHPAGLPQLASRPGAAYTIYLDFGGFTFDGAWGGGSNATDDPGTIPAYDSAVNAFSASDQNYITQVWAGVAEKYSLFNVNVTTIDPAVAAGQASTDLTRQRYYDKTARMMHTIIGDTSFTAAGVSYEGVTPYSYNITNSTQTGNGYHTDFVTPTGTGGEFGVGGIVGAASHENGHGFNLEHQSDYNSSGGKVNEYSSNDDATGNGSVSPVMGVTYYSQRGVWRQGTSDQNAAIQNDVTIIAGDSGNSLVDDGVGHTAASATLLPTTGTTVNFAAARGTIIPTTANNPNPIGAGNYTADVYAFNSSGGTVSLTVHNGGSRGAVGTADSAVMLASSLSIQNSSGTVVATATENYASQTETISQTLPAGRYYAVVNSAGGQVGKADSTAYYFDQGSYFITGTGVTGQSVGTYYWQGGGAAATWASVSGGTSNWRSEHTAGVDKGAAPGSTDNVFLSVDSGATNLSSMTLGGSRTINSLTFTGTGTTAATTPVTIAADGSTLTLAPYVGHIDQSATAVATGVGLVVQPGAAADTIAANVALALGQTWQVNNNASNPLTVTGTVSGAAGAGLTVTGGGKLVLSGSNSYSGGTYVNGSTVTFAAGGLGTGQVTMTNAGVIQFATGNTADLTAGGRAVAVVAGGGTVDTNGNTVTLANGVADAHAGSLTKAGTGTLTVGGSSDPTGLFVRGGALILAAGSAYSTAAVSPTDTGNYYASVGQYSGDVGGLTVGASATLTVAGDLNAADNAGTTGTLAVVPNATVNARTLYVGKYGSAKGAVVQTGGTVQEANVGTTPGDWRIGGGASASDAAAVGTYTITGGTLNAGPANLQVGAYGTGTVTQSGGLVTTTGYLSIGRFAGSVGTYDLSSGNGTLTANGAALLIVGEQGTGTLKVGGTSDVTANTLAVGLSDGTAATGTVLQTGGVVDTNSGVTFGGAASGSAAVSATYNLAGGILVTPSVSQGTGGTNVTGVFHFNGGTLLANATTTTLMQGLTRADVSTGGATVNTAAYADTIAQPLLHSATLGTTADGGLTKLGIGTLTLAGIETYTGPTNVASGTLAFAANPTGGGYRRQPLPGGLTVASGATAVLLPAATKTDRTLLVPGSLSVAGQLDVTDNDLDVTGSSLAAVTQLAANGFAGGTWTGTGGIVSSTAAADPAHLTGVGVIPNTADGVTPLYATFDGRPAAATDVLVRYTYYGDTNLDGSVTAADYTRVDAGFVDGLTGWFNGDFNYDGVVDGTDYALMDNVFNQQTGGVAAPATAVASPAAQVAAVPEPTAVGLVALAAAFGRRRRRASAGH